MEGNGESRDCRKTLATEVKEQTERLEFNRRPHTPARDVWSKSTKPLFWLKIFDMIARSRYTDRYEERRQKGEGRTILKAGGYPTPVELARSLPNVTTD